MAATVYNRYFALVMGTILITLLGMPIITPSLPAVREALGVPTERIGLIMAVYAFPAIFFVPILGLAGDRWGKKWVMLPSFVLFGVGGFAFMADTFETLLWLRFLQGIGASALSGIGVGMVGDYYAGHDRIKVLGSVSVMQNVLSGLLPIAGGTLATIAWHAPFLAGFLALPVGLYCYVVMDVPEKQERSSGREFLGHAWRSITDRRALEILAMTGGFIFIGFGVFVTYIPIFLVDTFSTSLFFVGVIVAARSVSGAIVASQLARLTRRFSYRGLIASAFLVQAAGVAVVPLLPNDWSVMIAALCYGGAFGIVRPALQMMMLENAPADLRAFFGAGIAFSLRIAQTAGPAAAGLVLAFGSFDTLFYSAAAVAAFLSILAFSAKSLQPAATKAT